MAVSLRLQVHFELYSDLLVRLLEDWAFLAMYVLSCIKLRHVWRDILGSIAVVLRKERTLSRQVKEELRLEKRSRRYIPYLDQSLLFVVFLSFPFSPHLAPLHFLLLSSGRICAPTFTPLSSCSVSISVVIVMK
ncbi:hypothetical protein Taro_049376 [Colocasia esculenta]|uniref:Uncharacterized protein n=1 Tax=Colocasia esculenta TaxID=4460 RepID=A0A843XAW4_COLES|nr:hypothetical protein [Colocasia esculenta]